MSGPPATARCPARATSTPRFDPVSASAIAGAVATGAHFVEALDRLYLDYDKTFNQEVDAIPAVEDLAAIDQRQRLLAFE
jgi:hypothetical protein